MNKKLAKSLEGPFTKIARSMSRTYGITVIPSGYACCTDGTGTIYIPFNADDLQEVDQRVLHGMLDHEVAHVVEEREAEQAQKDGKRAKTPMQVMKACKNNRERMLLNVFEDIRIEIKAARRYIGVADNLKACNLNSADAFKRRHDAGKMEHANFWHTLGSAIIMKARGESTEWLPERVKPFLDLVEEEVAESQHTQRVEECYALALRVIEKIKDFADAVEEEMKERAKSKAKDGEKKPGKSGEKAEGKAEKSDEKESDGEAGEGEKEGEEEGQGEESDEAGGASSEDGEGEDEGKAGSGMTDSELKEAAKAGRDSMRDAEIDDLAKLAKDSMERRARDDRREHRRYLPNPVVQKRDRWLRPIKSLDNYARYKESLGGQVSALKAKLLTVLRSRAESHRLGDQERGELDSASLYSLRLGNKRVFSKRTEADSINTAVSILIDLSGSMAGRKIVCAAQIMVALGETFSALNIPFEMVGFHNPSHGGVAPTPEYDRYFPFDYVVYKSFNDSYAQARPYIGGIQTGEQNVDGEAVLTVARRLNARKERRKLMFVLSDGAPAGGCGDAASHNHLIEAVKMVENSGIEIYGIGALTSDVKAYYPKHVVINDIAELAVGVYKLVRNQLMSKFERGAA